MITQLKNNKIVVVSTQRSGSAYLVNLLNSHPDVCFFNEPFGYHIPAPFTLYNFAKDKFHKEAIAKFCAFPPYTRFNWNLLSRQTTREFLMKLENGEKPFNRESNRPIRGFNTMYGNVKNNLELRNWVSQKDVKVIHLMRKNILRLLISKHIKDQTHVAHITHEKVELDFKPITMNVKRTLWQLKTMESFMKTWSAKLNRQNYHEIFYEEIGSEITQSELLNFIQVPVLPLTTIQNQINTKTVSEVVLNYNELKGALINTRFAWMLGEE